MDVAAHLDLALELADTADEITMARFRAADLHVTTKPDLTPVSEADQAVERAIRTRLADATGHAVLGEEFGHDPGDDAEFRWIIDPIDGTKGYVRGLPIWCTLIGLEYAGELVVGVCSAPALGARWWAGRGLGAFRDGERIGPSAVSELGDAQISFAWDTKERFDADGIGDKLLTARAPVLALPRHRRLLAAHARRRRRGRHLDRPDRQPLGHRRARADHRGGRRAGGARSTGAPT